MKIKICGINRPIDVEYVNQSKPDYVGFIVNFPKSHRSVNEEDLSRLASQVDPSIQKVGVFVDEDVNKILEYVEAGYIDIIQLHGGQSEEVIDTLRQSTSQPIWKAFSILSDRDLEEAAQSSADLVLLDNKGGGTGEAFDHSLIQDFNRPYLLAGGMNEETIPQAIEQLRPYGIDTSSGTETDKKKDPVKIEKIVRMVQDA